MPNSTTIASEQLDYPFLLLTHMVCADQQIHSEESKALHELASQTKVGQRTLEEVEKILAQDEHFLCAEDVASRVPLGQQSEAIKNNLRDSRRLEYFLKDPDKLFAMDGKSGLGGHIERIHRYAKEHYANDYFDVVPVLLLAAQLSGEPAHKERKDKLFKASRMQDFLDSIRVSLVEHGVIRRSLKLTCWFSASLICSLTQ